MCSFNYISLKIMGPERYAKREKRQQFWLQFIPQNEKA